MLRDLTIMRHCSMRGDFGQDRVDFCPDTGLQLPADQSPFAQHVERVVGAQEGGHGGCIDCERPDIPYPLCRRGYPFSR